MALSNSQYDVIMRAYGRQQIENHHQLEEHCREIYRKLLVIREPETETASRSVVRVRKPLERETGVLDKLREDLQDLWEQKALIIKAAGYPDSYLELQYRYPDCRDAGLVDGKKCHCFLKAQTKLLHDQSNLEDVLERENFSTLSFAYYDGKEIFPQIGTTNVTYVRRVAKECRDFVEEFDKQHENLLLTGSTGMGKTFLTNCIARGLMDTYHSVVHLTASDLFEVLFRNKFDYENAEDVRDMYRFILDCDPLIIDDLGMELSNSFTSSQSFYCINERTNMKRSTVTSANLSPTRLRDFYTNRVTSRITSGYRMTPLYGGDIRLLKKQPQSMVIPKRYALGEP